MGSVYQAQLNEYFLPVFGKGFMQHSYRRANCLILTNLLLQTLYPLAYDHRISGKVLSCLFERMVGYSLDDSQENCKRYLICYLASDGRQ